MFDFHCCKHGVMFYKLSMTRFELQASPARSSDPTDNTSHIESNSGAFHLLKVCYDLFSVSFCVPFYEMNKLFCKKNSGAFQRYFSSTLFLRPLKRSVIVNYDGASITIKRKCLQHSRFKQQCLSDHSKNLCLARVSDDCISGT